MAGRSLSLLDSLICGADRALRTLTSGTQTLTRVSPKPASDELSEALTDSERKHAAGLMRVNHAGEVCAQALYQGQALTAKLPEVRAEMEQAANEEIDHLAWCEERIVDLGSHTSFFNPVWYSLSFGIGATAGLISDKISLGFVAATEDQVCKHLEKHLQDLPPNDRESRAIVEQMLVDEAKHAHAALDAGGVRFPGPIKGVMTLISKTMTETSYRL
ncbi:2-polyprenyl-3-methyl-6-methoxy-1,4-benzoquinone monooxygenase [Teredinibacter haidensis]|uniref:2-polyprenyl-3-methyl-6-methoxy-1,4-benzoquinone monooxygenase n=1 Tax=Teredinibacter haidensis TaxID=2731755 RepID=UPI000948AE7B|nr:2-polyprenyl-3-methyl-6-methoxy-1,4-benzoquinone monooxygenase [Teredinibacter haidensis]